MLGSRFLIAQGSSLILFLPKFRLREVAWNQAGVVGGFPITRSRPACTEVSRSNHPIVALTYGKLEDIRSFAGLLRYHSLYTPMDFGFEMIFFALLALVLFGPRKLPQIAREVGRFMAEFKRAGNQFQNQIQEEIRNMELEESINSAKNISAQAGEIISTVKDPNPVASALGRLTDRIKSIPQDHDAQS